MTNKLLNSQMAISVSGYRLKDLKVKLLYGYMVGWLQDDRRPEELRYFFNQQSLIVNR